MDASGTGGMVRVLIVPQSGPLSSSAASDDGKASVASLQSVTSVVGTPAFFHLGGGVFRQWHELDSVADCASFSVSQACAALSSSSGPATGLAGLITCIDVQCDSAVNASYFKAWILDNASRSSAVLPRHSRKVLV